MNPHVEGFEQAVNRTIVQSTWVDDGTSSDADSRDFQQIAPFENEAKIGEKPFNKSKMPIYDDSILRHYKSVENERVFNANYLKETQKNLVVGDRDTIVLWMLIKSSQLDISAETTFLSVKMFDFVIGLREFARESLLLHACSCIMIAAKMEDTENQEICSNLCSFSALKEQSLIDDELSIACVLSYNAYFVTPLMYLGVYAHKIHSTFPSCEIDNIYLISKVISYCTLTTGKCSGFSSDKIAKGSMLIALKFLKSGDMFRTIGEEKEIDSCLSAIKEALCNISADNNQMKAMKMFSQFADKIPSIISSF